jgi:hypothetical protein
MTETRATRAGRPSIGPEVKTRVTSAEADELERRAKAAGIDRSALIRQYIRDGLAKPQPYAAHFLNGHLTIDVDPDHPVLDVRCDGDEVERIVREAGWVTIGKGWHHRESDGHRRAVVVRSLESVTTTS